MSSRTYHTQNGLTEQVLSQMSDAQWQELFHFIYKKQIELTTSSQTWKHRTHHLL
ncbi:hypothetical protein [Dictyobacter arantiisoli]|uniref:Uncharacterized protein n=1 Tax=Dictyobacter arantiisoli TaxID=2014874 RepID=A0A5A5TIC4_9CHLR|nr:hypothetical protein [Dictyobacter arantiisoli]GCF11072.1 hypothetical protein KDI_46360 [Dictyobacter arantiisoli]